MTPFRKSRSGQSALAVTIAVSIFLGSPAVSSFAARQDANPPHQARLLWAYDSPRSIKHFRLLPSGDLFVATDRNMVVFDRETGKPRWSRDDFTGCGREQFAEARYHVRCKYRDQFDIGFAFDLSKTNLLVGHNPNDGQLAVLDLTTGSTVYEADGRTPGKIEHYWHGGERNIIVIWMIVDSGHVLAGLDASGLVLWQTPTAVAKDLVWLGAPVAESLLVYGKNRENKRIITEVDLSSGRIVWESVGVLTDDLDDGPRMIGGGGQWRQKPYRFAAPVADSPSSVIVFINKDGPMRFSREGKRLWQVSSLSGEHPSSMLHFNGAVHLIRGDHIYAVDAASGAVRWNNVSRASPIGLQQHERGLLVWSENTLELLDPQTGLALWSRAATLPTGWSYAWSPTVLFEPTYFGSVSPRLVSGEVAFIAGFEALVSVNLRDGAVTTLSGYSLQDREPIRSLEMVDGDLVLTSAQSLLRFSRQGEQVFRRDFKTVRAGFWEKQAAIALSLGAAVVGTASNVFNPLENAMYFAYRHRYSSGVSRDKCFLFDNQSAGDDQRRFGITCVDRGTGEDRGTLWVNERGPDVLIDSESQTLFLRSDSRTIAAWRFDTTEPQ